MEDDTKVSHHYGLEGIFSLTAGRDIRPWAHKTFCCWGGGGGVGGGEADKRSLQVLHQGAGYRRKLRERQKDFIDCRNPALTKSSRGP